MEKSRIIIVEGPQGTGKTTLANYLRDNIAGSNLYRLSGQRDKSQTGKELSEKMYFALLEYMEKMQGVPMDLIFDRTFFTEEVYSRLGYKDYSFSDVYYRLVDKLLKLDYDINFICLYLKDVELYRQRLMRESHHNYQSFSVTNSSDQQRVYLDISDELIERGMKVIKQPMDEFEPAYNSIRKSLKIKKKI